MAKTVKKLTRPQMVSLPSVAKQLNRRVAAYARVSTGSEQQQSSIEAQQDYYIKLIDFRLDWTFAGLYIDDGVSGTRTEHREGFNQMIQDALAGKIDLIVTKSISRFARNTVDSLSTIRLLKEHGVEIFFEKDYIWKRSYPVYGRFSLDKTQYLVVLRCILILHFVACRLFVA